MKNIYNREDGLFHKVLQVLRSKNRGWKLRKINFIILIFNLYFYILLLMDVVYRLNAKADYIEHRDSKRVRGFWYLSALTWLRAYQLREKGYPVKWVPYFERHENGDEGFQPVFYMMLGAYASGEDWMLSEIQHFSRDVLPKIYEMIQGKEVVIFS